MGIDFVSRTTDAARNTYWRLASGHSVIDAQRNVVAEPTSVQVMAQQPANAVWQSFTGNEIGFIERWWASRCPLTWRRAIRAGCLLRSRVVHARTPSDAHGSLRMGNAIADAASLALTPPKPRT